MIQEHIPLPVGAVVQDARGERYTIEGILGRGGFSSVYKVRDRRTKEQVYALKEMVDPPHEDRRNLLFEAEVLMRLDYPALPHVYQVFENPSLKRVYLLMDYIEGKDLEVLLREQQFKRFSLPVVIALMEPIVQALIYLHAQKPPIVHRDIKPANIIIPTQGREALLVDFGLAKEYINDKTTNIFRYGTPGYAAPEQYGQGTNLRTDIYGLAATVYTLLTGIVPTDALTRSVNQHDGDTLKRVHQVSMDIPIAVSRVVARGMGIRKEDRYETIEAFWLALREAAQHPEVDLPTFPHAVVSTHANAKLVDGPEQRRKRRNKRIQIAVMFVLALLLVAGVLNYMVITIYHSNAAQIRPTATAPTVSAHYTCPAAAFTNSDYPQLSTCYGGTIFDVGGAGEKTALYLTNIKQNQADISGNFQGLGLNGMFKGKIDKNSDFRFIVTFPGRSDMLSCTGSIRTGGDLVGDFNVVDKSGQKLGDYGNWNVGMMTSMK